MNHYVRGLSISILFFSIAVLLKAQDGFRVYPYLQHPAPDAMTLLWFSEEPLPGQLSWEKKDSDDKTVVESDPEAATTLAYPDWEDSVYFGGEAPSFPYRHRVRLEELEPRTEYEYSVVQGTHTFRASFWTSLADNDSLRFVVYADPETEPESTGKLASWVDPVSLSSRSYLVDQTTGYRNNLEVIRSRHLDLVLIAGDLTQHGGEQRDWDEFWRHNTDSIGTESLAGQIPVLAVPGNHEYFEGAFMDGYNQPGSERAINRFRTYFESPSNLSPNPEQEGRYYSTTYGPATFIMLDVCNNGFNGSDEDTNFYLLGENDPEGGNAPDFGVGSKQYLWLEEKLLEAQERALFTFVVLHHAPYSSGPHGFPAGLDEFSDNQSGVPVRALTPLFMKYGVDAVFSGHDEMWERSEITGVETEPDGGELIHTIQFYDVGTGGDGLREPEAGADNPYQKFLVHTDVPEVWEGSVFKEGGKHYGHLEVNILPLEDHVWQALLTPVYILPLFDAVDSTYSGFERKEYDDQVMITKVDSVSTVSADPTSVHFMTTRIFPNPFFDHVTIEYSLPEASEVVIRITDAQGRIVRIIPAGFKSAGRHKENWDGADENGYSVAVGFYVISLVNATGKQLSRMRMLVEKGS